MLYITIWSTGVCCVTLRSATLPLNDHSLKVWTSGQTSDWCYEHRSMEYNDMLPTKSQVCPYPFHQVTSKAKHRLFGVYSHLEPPQSFLNILICSRNESNPAIRHIHVASMETQKIVEFEIQMTGSLTHNVYKEW